jgi:hypothetical protein
MIQIASIYKPNPKRHDILHVMLDICSGQSDSLSFLQTNFIITYYGDIFYFMSYFMSFSYPNLIAINKQIAKIFSVHPQNHKYVCVYSFPMCTIIIVITRSYFVIHFQMTHAGHPTVTTN